MQQAGGFDAGVAKIEQFGAGGAARGLADQHGVGRKEGGEHHDVAEQEDPEAEADHDPLRRRAAIGSDPGVAVPPARG